MFLRPGNYPDWFKRLSVFFFAHLYTTCNEVLVKTIVFYFELFCELWALSRHENTVECYSSVFIFNLHKYQSWKQSTQLPGAPCSRSAFYFVYYSIPHYMHNATCWTKLLTPLPPFPPPILMQRGILTVTRLQHLHLMYWQEKMFWKSQSAQLMARNSGLPVMRAVFTIHRGAKWINVEVV